MTNQVPSGSCCSWPGFDQSQTPALKKGRRRRQLRWNVPLGFSSSYLLVLKCLRDCCSAPDDATGVGGESGPEWETRGAQKTSSCAPSCCSPPVFRLTASGP